MGAFMATLGYNAEHEGMGGPGSDPEGTGTSQGDTTGEGDTLKLNYVAPALAYSAPPQQTDIQNNFSTSSQYAQRYGLSGRVHF